MQDEMNFAVIGMCLSIVCALYLLPNGIKFLKLRMKTKEVLLDIHVLMCIFFGTVATVTSGLCAYEIYDEKNAVYTQKQDTLVVTGTYPSKHTNPPKFSRSTRQYNHIIAKDKNNLEYSMKFLANGGEPTFVERGDTVIAKFQYRNGERITDKDSIVANLTRDRLVANTVDRQR